MVTHSLKARHRAFGCLSKADGQRDEAAFVAIDAS